MAEPLKYAEHGVVSWSEYEQIRRERDGAYAATDVWVKRAEVLQGKLSQAHAAIDRLGMSLADAGHQWTNEQRRAWERAERLTRDNG